MKKIIFTLIFFLSFILKTTSQEKPDKIIKVPENYIAQKDVIYTTVNNWEGRMDLYTNPTSQKPTPVVINIHGGGWVNGRKETQSGFRFLFKSGFAVANVAYRLRDVAKAPAAIEDVRCALIYIHKHAKELNIDINKIIIMGGSAGGHLALMAGLLNNNKKFDTNCYYNPTINVAAIINRYGATDMSLLKTKGSARKWMGNKINDKKFVRSISPISYVSKKSPPVFIIHGDEDPSIPYKQSELLYKKLKKNRVTTKFITVKGGKHGKFTKEEKRNFKKEVKIFLKSIGIII